MIVAVVVVKVENRWWSAVSVRGEDRVVVRARQMQGSGRRLRLRMGES